MRYTGIHGMCIIILAIHMHITYRHIHIIIPYLLVRIYIIIPIYRYT